MGRPDICIAWAALAGGQVRAGRLDQAVGYADLAMAEFRKAAELPTHAESLVRIATAYAAAGQPDRAEPVLRHVVDTLRGQATPWLAEAERIFASLPPVGRD